MLMSMNVFYQTTPKLLCFPSSKCHGRRISHKPAVLVSPATMEFNPKLLHFLPCHGFLHSTCKLALVSPTTMKFSPVLFAMPRGNEEFSSDNEEEAIIKEHEGHRSLISSDNVHEEQSKKVEFGEYVVRKATLDVEFRASAWLKAEGFYEDRTQDRYVGSFKKKHTEQEFTVIMRRCKERAIQPFICIIAVRKEGESVHNGMLKNVIGTLDFRVEYLLQGETYPEEFLKTNMFKTFKKGESQKCGIISNVTVAKSARQQGVGSSMLKFAIKSAKENGIKQVILNVSRENKPALALYEKLGFTIREERNICLCSINLG